MVRMDVEKKIIQCILDFVRSEKYGKLFTEEEIVSVLSKRYPFFNEESLIYDAIDMMVEDKLLIRKEGFIRPNTLMRVLKNWIDFR